MLWCPVYIDEDRQCITILSFRPPDVISSLTHLQDVLQRIFFWMTANLLTLNSSKTEFLLIGLKQQLAKMHNSFLNTTHSARNLGIRFDEHLTFSDQISALCNLAILMFVNFAASVLILIPKQPVSLQPQSYIPNLTT